MFKILMIVVICLITVSCAPNPKKFETLMKQEGISEAKDEGMPLFGCGKEDSMIFSTKFSGIKNNVKVKGVICSNLLKGYTIRYE
jgi:PBP1b-binding outer membrane lipoprotein LpoB